MKKKKWVYSLKMLWLDKEFVFTIVEWGGSEVGNQGETKFQLKKEKQY